MRIWPFRKRQQLVVTPSGGIADTIAKDTGGAWRRGMWVMLGERVAILTQLVGSRATVMVVDRETGTNVLEVECQLGELARSNRSQIPPCRRLHLTEGDLEAMGYR